MISLIVVIIACSKDQYDVRDDGFQPGNGLGAGGFDSSMFLHLCRNWYSNSNRPVGGVLCSVRSFFYSVLADSLGKVFLTF